MNDLWLLLFNIWGWYAVVMLFGFILSLFWLWFSLEYNINQDVKVKK